VVNLLSAGGSANGNANAATLFVLIRDATLTGPVSWAAWSTNSCTYADTGATGCSFSNNAQIIWTGSVAQTGNFLLPFTDDITLQPGETVTLAVRSASATAACIGQLNTREDQ
jgi:FtsP/CotA-like multicopper oxidase with cupredoxin domain